MSEIQSTTIKPRFELVLGAVLLIIVLALSLTSNRADEKEAVSMDDWDNPSVGAGELKVVHVFQLDDYRQCSPSMPASQDADSASTEVDLDALPQELGYKVWPDKVHLEQVRTFRFDSHSVDEAQIEPMTDVKGKLSVWAGSTDTYLLLMLEVNPVELGRAELSAPTD